MLPAMPQHLLRQAQCIGSVILQLLTWLIKELLASGAAANLEQLLVVYCVERRNPLSAVAAIERVLVKVNANW